MWVRFQLQRAQQRLRAAGPSRIGLASLVVLAAVSLAAVFQSGHDASAWADAAEERVI